MNEPYANFQNFSFDILDPPSSVFEIQFFFILDSDSSTKKTLRQQVFSKYNCYIEFSLQNIVFHIFYENKTIINDKNNKAQNYEKYFRVY